MSALFSPMTVKRFTFRNRVVLPPMVCVVRPELAHYAGVEGVVSEVSIEHYARRAQAGTGLIMVEATAVDEGGRCWEGAMGAYADRHLPGLARLAERIHEAGAVAGIQLVHHGPQGSPDLAPDGLVGPSDAAPTGSRPAVRGLTVEEIHAIEGRFEEAAERVVQAGFDLVEVHAAHGFLLDSFLLQARNRRQDEYGGDLDGRMRIVLETCRRIRRRIGGGPLLTCRTCLFNKREEGFGAEDLETLVGGLEEAGNDLLDVSTDGVFKGWFGSPRSLGQWVKGMTGLPVIAAGGLGDARDAERAVSEGHADFAAVGTAMLDDADWTRRAREELGA